MHIIQSPLFDFEAFIVEKGNNRLVKVLEALPAEKLLITLEKERWTGRKGYPIRGMWAALIAGIINQCKTIADIARLLKRDKETRLICGFSKDIMPGEDALSARLHQSFLSESSKTRNQPISVMPEVLRCAVVGWRWFTGARMGTI